MRNGYREKAIACALLHHLKSAVVKLEETLKKDAVHLVDCKKYNKLDIPRKWKSTGFFCEIPQTKWGKPPPGQIQNMFHSDENLPKLCAEGAIENLLNMLHFSQEYIDIFGNWPHQIWSPS